MNSTPAPQETDPHDTFAITSDVVLAARPDKKSSSPSQMDRAPAPRNPATSDAAAGVSAPSVDATFRPAVSGDDIKVRSERPAISKLARRALLGFALALCSTLAAAGWTSYGDTIKALLHGSTQNHDRTSAPPPQPGSPLVETAGSDQAAAPAVLPAPPVPDGAPSVAAPSAELTQMLASMSQQIEQLKTSIDQLKAGQEQISREIAANAEPRKQPQARSSEPNLRPRMPPPLRPAVAAARNPPRPVSTPADVTATPTGPPAPTPSPLPAQPVPAAQATTQPDFGPVMRPPLPVR